MTQAEAVLADRNGDILRAIELYEASIKDASEEALVNLAVLYWQTTDYGLSTTLRLSPEFVGRAGVRVGELLDEVARRYPRSAAGAFWRKYIAWADLGDQFDPEDCRRILRENPEYLEPAMYLGSQPRLFSTGHCQEGEREALMLLAQCKQAGTTRARYIVSVIQAAQLHASQATPA